MDNLGLSSRQKKLLKLLKGRDSYLSGDYLAGQLGVCSRTVRSDITAINSSLKAYGARIISEHRKGYLYQAGDTKSLPSMNQVEFAFLSRDERVRYLACRFCLMDGSADLFDLEDEIYVSRTTLEHDLRKLRMTYVQSGPRIGFIQEKNRVSFENNERKRRFILNQLFQDDWDYHDSGNGPSSRMIMDSGLTDKITLIVPPCLEKYRINIEDPDLVALNLAVAIMIERIRSGHFLPDDLCDECPDADAVRAADEIFKKLSDEFDMAFPGQEKKEICRMIAEVRLPDLSEAILSNDIGQFDALTRKLSESYLQRLNELFSLDLLCDPDFHITLLYFIRYLQASSHVFSKPQSMGGTLDKLLPEFELSWAIQDLAIDSLGFYLSETELIHLAYILCGALECIADFHPSRKLNTVICCHMNMTAAWALKRKVLAAFDKYLNVTAIVPVNSRSNIDLPGAELILSTVRKPLKINSKSSTIRISSLLLPDDYLKITAFIQDFRIGRLFPGKHFSMDDLFLNAIWISSPAVKERFDLIEILAKALEEDGCVGADFEADILRREAISSFAIRPGLLFLHSLIPAGKTRLSIALFDRPFIWNSNKIRIAVMGAFRREDMPLFLWMTQILNGPLAEPDKIRQLKSPEDVVRHFRETK